MSSHRPRSLGALRDTLRVRLAKADPSTEPFLRAFLLAYAASTLPNILRTVISLALGKKRNFSKALRHIVDALVTALNPRGLAFSSGIAVGGAKWLEPRLEPLVRRQYMQRVEQWRGRGKGKEKIEGEGVDALKDDKRVELLTTWASATLSSLLAITLLQSSPAYKRAPLQPVAEVVTASAVVATPTPYASVIPSPSPATTRATIVHISGAAQKKLLVPQSPTLDLTLFLLVRATDSLVRGLHESSRWAKSPKGSLADLVATHGDTIVFWLSCYRIMWCCASAIFVLRPHEDSLST